MCQPWINPDSKSAAYTVVAGKAKGWAVVAFLDFRLPFAENPVALYPSHVMQVDPLVTVEDWKKRLPPALDGKRDSEILFGREVGPRAERSIYGPWKILTRIDYSQVEAARQQTCEDWEGGADGFVLVEVGAISALRELPLHVLALQNEAGDAGAEALQRLIGSMPLDPARLNVDFGVSGVALAKGLAASGYAGPFARADGRGGHGKGFSEAEELGSVMAVALGHFRAMEFLDDTQLAGAVSITLSAVQNPFATMAKFRAARVLWRQLLAQCGLPFCALKLHGESSRVMFAGTDAHGNILRCVTAAFGAGLGGADSFCVLPFSQAQGLPNNFARRVARNLQHVLLREAELWRVDDPASGAGFVESETSRLCERAWDVMRDCERGKWPTGNMESKQFYPVIGVERYQPKHHIPAEVEAGT